MRYLLFTIFLTYASATLACVCVNYDFDSLEDIEEYKFIGLVKIDSIFLLPGDTADGGISHHISFSIIELYRGDSVNQLQVSGANPILNLNRWTSCDMRLNPGEEWILFAFETSDSTLQTGSCTFSRRYRSKNGLRDWHYRGGFKEIEKVKKLLNIQDEIDTTMNGIYTERYPNGSIEVESEYQTGLLNGLRTARYPNGQVMTREEYLNGLKHGVSKWFYENGSLKHNYSYFSDQPVDSCWRYHENGVLARRSFYSKSGQRLFSEYYSKEGNLRNNYLADTVKNVYVKTQYFDTGELHYTSTNEIGKYSDSNTTQYFKNGQVEGTWIYFDEGAFKAEIKRWNEDGELIFHQRTNWDGEKEILIKGDNKR